jgi:hypothetical protein
MVWGGNGEFLHFPQSRQLMQSVDYQLGNGKRSSLAVPQHLPPLVQRLVDPNGAVAAEAGLSSGTVRPFICDLLMIALTNASFTSTITSGSGERL